MRCKAFSTAFVLFILSSWFLFAQEQKTDSLAFKIQKLKQQSNYEQDTLYINLLYDLGRQISLYNLDSLQVLSKETIRLSKSIDFIKGEVKGHVNLGTYYSENGKQNQAVENFSIALAKAKQINNLELLLRAKSLLAIEHEYKEDYAGALRHYMEGIEIASNNNHDSWLSTFYVNTSNLYNLQKEYKQGLLFLLKAKELNKKIGDDRISAMTLANLTATYIETGDLKSASENVDQCIGLFENLKLKEWLTYAYELKANIYLQQKQYEAALSWFQKSEKIHEAIEQPRYKIPLYNGIAKTYFGLEQYKTSEIYASRAVEISEKINILDEREESLKLLYEIKKVTDQPVEALAYLEKYKNISDTISKNKNEKELRILKSNLEFDQEKERYLAENNKKVAEQKLYFYGALFIILAFLVIIFIMHFTNKVQDELNQKLTSQTSELKKKEKFLREANNTKSKLFSIIAHDLKGPINSFKMMFDLVDAGEINTKDFMGFVPKMGQNVNSISFTLNNLLAWGHSQMNGSVTKPIINDIAEIVEENLALLTKIAEKKDITLKNNLGSDVITWSDKDQISIVIRNLISNALKFTPENGIILIDSLDRTNMWEICVKDNGIGMSKEALGMIFNVADTYTTYGTNNEKGTGLGLNLCKEMVEKNGGTIWATSILNIGTSFFFTIPKEPATNSAIEK
ncbi:tetratricopeptide repeat protein [Aurantibacter crassamenti]|uniref:tetratricopeptide repeat-containing sensor histidine kinase n=1 Tax=Aurantibacter crassamenti TaxID=1837375 RepID=UPI00193A4B2C|nr:ATP-binding protein [Aurantibacter crassamenti]MBM1106036.1 tetratricopeptide repeat protein [Aurantibacter crassamenti]